MSDSSGAREWVNPRYREMLAGLSLTRVQRQQGRRPRRICPHGSGVTMMVDLHTGSPLNVACKACCQPA